MPKRHQLTAKVIKAAAKRLAVAQAKRKCHFCRKCRCNALVMVVVSCHERCAENANFDAARNIDAMTNMNREV